MTPMPKASPRPLPRLAALALAGATGMSPAPSQAYPIDCAILLCLAGGWPPSAECSAARAEFIRRITPWPVEPPLQIWRCPMRAAWSVDPAPSPMERLHDIAFRDAQNAEALSALSPAIADVADIPSPLPPIPGRVAQDALWPAELVPVVEEFSRENGVADIDIGGPEFDFVRAIRVFHVIARQRDGDRSGCKRSATVRLGRYGEQGDYAWEDASVHAVPAAFTGLERFGQNCPGIRVRAVFVEWRDHEGTYGFEQVNY